MIRLRKGETSLNEKGQGTQTQYTLKNALDIII